MKKNKIKSWNREQVGDGSTYDEEPLYVVGEEPDGSVKLRAKNISTQGNKYNKIEAQHRIKDI